MFDDILFWTAILFLALTVVGGWLLVVSDEEGFLALAAASLLICALLFTWWIVRQDNHNWQNFYAQCTQDHKAYECTAMWRAGETNTVVVPVPIITR